MKVYVLMQNDEGDSTLYNIYRDKKMAEEDAEFYNKSRFSCDYHVEEWEIIE